VSVLATIIVLTGFAVPMYPDLPPVYDFNRPLECSYYPNAPCVVPVQPSIDPVERERREYEKRQRRPLCSAHPEQCRSASKERQ
jgi:hypothetical protein